ncbi:Bifunctional DNA primase/polymerase [Burkholderiales bacterium]|nr:Bifunctional DNA primase/polymerase [Burkholderiales bacterium]
MSKVPRRDARTARVLADDMRAAARAYAARGWAVIPIEARGKRPLVPWLEFQQRRAAVSEIESWFQRWPDANVGLVTGRISGVVVLDIDPRHGGLESLAGLEDEQGPLPRTVEAHTGGGGRHIYFAHPGATVTNRVALRPGVDVRADGGCVVAPPSLHPSGGRYEWAQGCAPQDLSAARMPAWLGQAMQAAGHSRHAPSHWRRLVSEGVAEGERNNTLASLTGHLLSRGVDPEVALELLLSWNRTRCRPPLADDDVVQVVQSITRLRERERETGEAAG